MFRFKKQLEDELNRIKNLKAMLPESTEKPAGTIIKRTTSKGETYSLRKWYRKKDSALSSRSISLGKATSEKARKTKEQFVIHELQKRLSENIKLLETTLEEFKSYDDFSVNNALAASIRDIPFDGLRLKVGISEDALKKWSEANYNRLEIDSDSWNYSLSGKKCRSKSEVIIANALDTNGIAYRVDEMLTLTDGEGYKVTKYPDFTILTPSGKKIYWEHFGFLKDQNYADRIGAKIRLFALNNIVIGDNFIISVDTVDGGIDSRYIQEVIDRIKGKYY